MLLNLLLEAMLFHEYQIHVVVDIQHRYFNFKWVFIAVEHY